MKVLILSPRFYSFYTCLELGFKKNGAEVFHYDYRQNVKAYQEKIHSHINMTPYKIRKLWYEKYVGSINSAILGRFKEVNPDLVLIYNNEMLLPATLRAIKSTAKVFFFLGDSPFYTPTNNHYLADLFFADAIFCPDSFWVEQFEMIGLKTAHFFLLGINPLMNFKADVSASERRMWGADLIFVGNEKATTWGYKRALFLNQFCDLDIKIYTSPPFARRLADFPGLKGKTSYRDKRISHEQLNTMLNCCKLYPVDANPGLINGIHARVFECIASGILPLVEYRRDLDVAFKGVELPVVKSYTSAKTLAVKYLENDQLRSQTLEELRQLAHERYHPAITIKQMLEHL